MKCALFVTLEYPPSLGGIGQYHRALVASSDWTDVLTSGSSEPTDENNRVWRRRFFWSLWPRWLPLCWTLWRMMRAGTYATIVVSHILPVGTAAYVLSLVTGLRYSVMLHGMDIGIVQEGRKARVARKILARAQWIICNSNATMNDALRVGAPLDRCIVMTPCPSMVAAGIVPPLIPPCNKGGGREGYKKESVWQLLSVGRLVERKGFDTAIAVVAELNHRGRATHLTIVGDGPDRKRLDRLVESLGAGSLITFVGAQCMDSSSVLYQQADCFLYLPRRLSNGDTEGFGIVCLDAALATLPVVVGRGTGAEETVVDGVTGIVTGATDVSKIVDDLEALLSNPERCQKFGDAGRVRILQEFRWEDRVQKLKTLLLP